MSDHIKTSKHFLGTELSRLVRSLAWRLAWEWDLTRRDNSVPKNDSVGFFFSPVTIKLLQRIRTKTSFDQFCIRCIRIYRLLWSSARVRNELLTNHRRDIKTQGEGRWTRQGWIYPMFWCDPTYFHYPTTKSKEIARVRKHNDSMGFS